MRRRISGTRKPSNGALLSGWLFADLLLALMLVFMGSVPSSSSASTAALQANGTTTAQALAILPTATATLTPTLVPPTLTPTPPRPTVIPTPSPQPGLARDRVEVRIANAIGLNSTDRTIRSAAFGELNRALLDKLRPDRNPNMRVGIVLIFGRAKESGDGQRYAENVSAALRDRGNLDSGLWNAFDFESASGTQTEEFWNGRFDEVAPFGGAVLWLYLITR